jgi:multimeric flavodoxin WrbA
MEIPMKVLAINGSPHMDSGNTSLILQPLLAGMKDAGAEVDLFYTSKLKIQPCKGDMSCWTKHPGECAIKDDMQILYPLFREAKALVFASPVYYAGVTGPLKNLIDRMLPLHGFSQGTEAPRHKIVLVSTCAAWNMEMFKPLLVQFEAICPNTEDSPMQLAGALLRPHAHCLKPLLHGEGRPLAEDVLKAAKRAGTELVANQGISQQTLERVSQELLAKDAYEKAMLEWFLHPGDSMQNS